MELLWTAIIGRSEKINPLMQTKFARGSEIYIYIWRMWDTCHTVEYDGCERPVIPCRSFFYVESRLFFFILCTGLSAFVPSYYLQSRLWIYIYICIYSFIYSFISLFHKNGIHKLLKGIQSVEIKRLFIETI